MKIVHLNLLPKPEEEPVSMINDPNISDAEIAAQWSVDAVRAGRVELAEALMRIAAQAVRAARRTVEVPYVGSTRQEQPRDGNADQVEAIGQNGAAVTAIMRAPSMRPPVPNGRRCEAEVTYPGSTIPGMCDQGVFWNHDQGRWNHVNTELDAEHYPNVPHLG